MPKFVIKANWTTYAQFTVEAESAEDAMEKVEEGDTLPDPKCETGQEGLSFYDCIPAEQYTLGELPPAPGFDFMEGE